MALTTRAIVLQRLGLSDDVTAGVAIVLSAKSSAGICTFSVTGGATPTLTLTPTVGGGPFTFLLTAAANETLDLLCGKIGSTTSDIFEADPALDIDGDTLSTILNVTSGVWSATSGESQQLGYDNSTAPTAGAMIDQLISEVDAAIGRHCNRFNPLTGAQTFESASRDEKYDGENEPDLFLRCPPVTAISAVTEIDTAGTATTIASTSYQTDLNRGKLHWIGAGLSLGAWTNQDAVSVREGPLVNRVACGWPAGFQNIRVQYTGGYEVVPADLQGIATEIVVEEYLNRRRNKQASSDSRAGQSTSYSSIADLIAQRADRLRNYVWFGECVAI